MKKEMLEKKKMVKRHELEIEKQRQIIKKAKMNIEDNEEDAKQGEEAHEIMEAMLPWKRDNTAKLKKFRRM